MFATEIGYVNNAINFFNRTIDTLETCAAGEKEIWEKQLEFDRRAVEFNFEELIAAQE